LTELEEPVKRAIHLLLTCAVLLVLDPRLARGQGAAGAGAPCSSEEHRQFDFWVGDWVVETEAGQVAGTNRVEKMLNGCVVAENWEGSGGSIGKSFNMFYERDGKWHQTWVDGAGGRLDVEGGWKNGKMVLSGTMPGRDGKPVLHEISFTPQPDGTVRQHWRASKDRGKSWQDLFVGIYSRKTSG